MIGDRRERQEGSRARERMADLICFLLAMFGQLLVRESKGSLLGVELDETGEKFLNEYLSLDDGKHLAELQEFEDTAIELDLIDQKKKHRPMSHQPPRVLYQIGDSEDELPECLDRSEVCSKVDLYGSPWVERQCRCPDGRTCPSSLHGDDGHTIVDKTRQYKLCEPVKRLPICRYFKLVAIVRLIESIYQVAERSNRRHLDFSSWRGPSERDGSASLLPMSARQRTLSSSKTGLQVCGGKPRFHIRIRLFSAKQTTLSAQGTLPTVHRT
ncbi:uncharacterized protein LOC126915127 isoform X2 [Bombus affinis]|uniref:Uncharacterized protein LOC100642474 isoform X2 n=1 Tax=Bombus terrestris TaxID=30195 RepID=A0A9C6W3X3_BOMTE|nr:uncharacterized protein LOC100642474 isoform X2 [Bombus terrestris]XP_050575512.1 uncharacterized protein LOC126915127 isoform X2 [Bombus affinis]